MSFPEPSVPEPHAGSYLGRAYLQREDMRRKTISNSDLIWMFHERLQEYGDHPFLGLALAIIRNGNGDWEVATQKKLPRRNPDLAKRLTAIEKELRKQYSLAAD
jgi:hypothetical protein